MEEKMKNGNKKADAGQKKPIGNKPMAAIKESKAYTKSYSKGKANFKK